MSESIGEKQGGLRTAKQFQIQAARVEMSDTLRASSMKRIPSRFAPLVRRHLDLQVL